MLFLIRQEENAGIRDENDIPIFDYSTIKTLFSEYCTCITCTYLNAMEIYAELKRQGEHNEIYFISNPFKAEDKFLSTTKLLHLNRIITILKH